MALNFKELLIGIKNFAETVIEVDTIITEFVAAHPEGNPPTVQEFLAALKAISLALEKETGDKTDSQINKFIALIDKFGLK